MTKLRSLAFLASTLTGCMIGGAGDGSSDEDIIGGTADTVHTSVVQLRYNQVDNQTGAVGLFQCSGTVIGPTTILTAGHCAGGFHYQFNPADSADPADQFGDGWQNAAYAVASPEYDGSYVDGHDVSVVKLYSATSIAPVGLGGAPAVGSTVTASGYGKQGFGDGPQGTRMMIDMSVNSVDDITFDAGYDGHGTCHGDSGGPALQNGVVVGTVSYGDTPDCHQTNHFVRVDDNLDFITSYLSF